MEQPLPSLRSIPLLLARYRRLRVAAAVFRIACLAACAQALLLAGLGLLSLQFPLSPGWLRAMQWTYALLLIPAAAWWVLARSRAHSRAGAARELDRANPGAPDPFRTSLSLENHDPATLRQLDGLYAGFLPGLVLPRPRFLPRLQRWSLGICAAVLLGAALLSGRPGEFLRRAGAPWHALNTLPIMRFAWDREPNPVVGLGDTVKVAGRAAYEGRTPRGVAEGGPGQAAFAHVRTGAQEKRFPLAMRNGRFVFAFGPVEGDFSLHFAAANGRSRTLRFRALPPPFLKSVQAVVEPPAYTRLRTDTLPPGVSHFPVLPGTRVHWVLAADRELHRLVWSSREEGAGSEARHREDTLGPGRDFRFDRDVRRPQSYTYALEDREGIRSRPSAPLRVEIIPDNPPELELVEPSEDGTLDRDMRLPLTLRVKDDFGVSSLKLVYRIKSDGVVKSEGSRDARDWLARAQAGMVETIWDMEGLDLRPENTLEFQLVATDNDTVNGPKSARSALRTLRLPSIQEVLAASRKQEQNALANLKSALQREKQMERKLEREAMAPKEEGPALLGEYEINRIMVDDPRSHAMRTESLLGQIQQSLQSKQANPAGQESREPASRSERDASRNPQLMAGVRETRELLKRSEPALPRGNQGVLPVEERQKNLENLMKAQKEQEGKMAALLDKLAQEKSPDLAPAKQQMENAARELRKNLESQAELRKVFQDEARQAKTKTEMIDQAIQEQMRMAEDMKAASDDIRKSMEQAKRNGLLSPDLLEKMKKVQELLREVLPDSLQKLMERKIAGQEVDAQELRNQLQKMLDGQGDLAENLNRAMAMLEQLRDRKRMQELRQILAELAARQEALGKRIQSGDAAAGEAKAAAQDAEQKSIQQETQKGLSDFASQAGRNRQMQELSKRFQKEKVTDDMQQVREALASRSRPGKDKAAASSRSAAGKLGAMAESLQEAMAGADNPIDLQEARDLLQESLSLSRLQLLIRSGAARRSAEGWEADEPTLYGTVAQTAQWLNERVKVFAAKVPFLGSAMMSEARNLYLSSREASQQYSLNTAEKSLKHNQNLSRELLKLLKMAQSQSSGGSGSGAPSAGAGGQGQGQGQGGGDLAGQLRGVSGKQMAINQATFQLLQAMLEGRQPSPGGRNPGGQNPGGQDPGGKESGGQMPGGEGPGGEGEGGQTPGGRGGEGTLPGLGNRQGELGEALESLAESLREEGGAAQKLRKLADEARQLEEDLRSGRLSPEEIRRRQERYQSRLLEAANSMEERGMSDTREAEASHGSRSEVAEAARAEEGRLLKLLKEARRNSRGLRLSGSQRKHLDEYYESLLTR